MLNRICICPSVFDIRRDPLYWNAVSHVLLGVLENGLLVSLFGNLMLDQIATRCRNREIPSREKIQVLLRRIKDSHRIEAVSSPDRPHPDTNDVWLEEAINHHMVNPLFAVVAKEADIRKSRRAIDSGICIAVEDAGANPLWASRRNTREIRRCRRDLLSCLRPVISHAKSVRLIDYILFRAQADGSGNAKLFLDTIHDLLAVWSSSDQVPFEFVVNTMAATSTVRNFDPSECREIFAPWRTSLGPLVPAGCDSVRIRFWRDQAGAKFPRNRFLLTESCAVQVGKGFDPHVEVSGTSSDIVSLLDETTARTIGRGFQDGRLFHVGDLEIS